MGRLCVLDSCGTNSYLIKPRDVQLHRFPSNPGTKKKWEEWVRKVEGPTLKDFVATKSSHTVCSKHFRPSDYTRKRLCFQSIPSVPPEALAEGQSGLTGVSMATISNVHSLAAPQSQRSPQAIEAAGKTLVESLPLKRAQTQTTRFIPPVKCSLPTQRSQIQVPTQHIRSITIPNGPVLHRPQCSTGQTVKNICDNISTYTFSVLGEQINDGSKVENTVVTYSSTPSRLQENASTSAVFQRGGLKSSSTPLRSPKNDSDSAPDDTAPQQRAKRRCYVGDIHPEDFECPVKAQKSLDVASSEVAKTKRKLKLMELKYVRAMRKIKTLVDMVKQCKEEKTPMDQGMQIKVCSSCRKVNLCH